MYICVHLSRNKPLVIFSIICHLTYEIQLNKTFHFKQIFWHIFCYSINYNSYQNYHFLPEIISVVLEKVVTTSVPRPLPLFHRFSFMFHA